MCGSKDHPNPAKLESNLTNEETLNLEKEKLKQSEKQLQKQSEKLINIKSFGTAQGKMVKDLVEDVQSLIPEEIRALEVLELEKIVKGKIGEIKNKINELEIKKKDLEEAKKPLHSLEIKLESDMGKIEELEKQGKELGDVYLKFLKKYEAENSALSEIKNEVPKDIQTPETLKKKYHEVEIRYNILLATLEKLQEENQSSLISLEKYKTQKKAVENMVEETENAAKKASDKFLEELSIAGFSLEEYQFIKLTEEEIDSLEKEIREFKENLNLLTNQYLDIEKELQGLDISDIGKLEEVYENMQQEEKILLEEKTHLYAKIKKHKEILDSCKLLLDKKSRREEEYNVLGDLAEIASGKNEARLTFERYVLAAFFEEIIAAASIRLLKMTENRYKLNRLDERAKYNAQSGLELEVFDNYTGQARHVKTLSGGEGFKASLALALGLADVVQSHSGGISLDTIFVDEGFGTLDPDSLENAIEILLDLQKTGRMVGIISHVPELKERIKVKLEVFSSPQGSKTKFKI